MSVTYDYDHLKRLVEIAAAANPPESHDAGPSVFDVVYPSIDGWQVAFFYDCGDLDYLDRFIDPNGKVHSVWDDPTLRPLRAWGGNDDTDHVLKLIADRYWS